MTNDKAITILQSIKAGTADAFIRKAVIKDALDLAISALEKQEPVKPLHPEMSVGGIICPCGNCGGELTWRLYNFCPWCGQAIDRGKSDG